MEIKQIDIKECSRTIIRIYLKQGKKNKMLDEIVRNRDND